MSEWLDRFNETAKLIQQCEYEPALQILNELEPTIRAQPELTPNTFVLFELRRASLYGSLGKHEDALGRYQSALKLAFHEVQDPIEVQSVAKKTLDGRNLRVGRVEAAPHDLAEHDGVRLPAVPRLQENMPVVAMTAAWYSCPTLYRPVSWRPR